jgi:putative membrane protein
MEEIELYDIIKIFHLTAVIYWIGSMIQLPRLFAYHSQVEVGSKNDEIFQLMEKRLLRYNINPSMILTFIFGFYLSSEIGFEFAWLHAKLTLVFILASYHGYLAICRKKFVKGANLHGEKFYKTLAQFPLILVFAIVALVILKPF